MQGKPEQVQGSDSDSVHCGPSSDSEGVTGHDLPISESRGSLQDLQGFQEGLYIAFPYRDSKTGKSMAPIRIPRDSEKPAAYIAIKNCCCDSS